MTKRAAWAGLLLLLWSTTAGAQGLSLKPKLACFPFTARNLEAAPFTESISSMLLNSVERTGYFEVLERRKIEGVLELAGLKFETLSHDALLTIGSRAGFDFIIFGGISRVSGAIVIETKLLNVRNHRLCSADSTKIAEIEISGRLMELAAGVVQRAKECHALDLQAGEQKPVAPPKEVKVAGAANHIRLRCQHENPAQIVGYKIFRSGSPDGPFVQVGTSAEGIYTDKDLKLNETFYYKAKAIGKTGQESNFSATVTGKTSVAPLPPILVNALAGIKAVQLTWRARPGGSARGLQVEGFKVYRKEAAEKDFAEVVRLGKEATTYRDSGLKDEVTYLYVLTAVNAQGAESDFSSALEVAPVGGGVQGKAESGRIRQIPLRWQPHENPNVEGYWVYRASQRDGNYQKVQKIPGRTTTQYTDSNLADRTTYWYRIASYDKAGKETNPSAPFAATTRGKPPVPAGLTAKSREVRKVSLQWNPVASPGDEIKGYFVYREGGNGELVKMEAGKKNSFVDDSPPLKDNTSYVYRVTSCNSADTESEKSEPVAAVTKALPKSPAGLKARSGEVKKISLSWQANSEADLKEYVLYRKGGEEKFAKIKSLKENSFTDAGLKDGTEYVYALQAVDQDNLASALSASVAARTKPVPPRPNGLKMIEKDGKKGASWEPSPGGDIKHYNIYKKAFLGAQKIASTPANEWSLGEAKGRWELFVTAEDAAGLESEGSDVLVIELK